MKNRLLRSLAMLALCSSGAAANTIGNLVFHDVNDNGTYEAGTDAPIDGVTLQLFNSGDDPTVATPVATATSGGGGIYSFAGVTDGTYFIYIPLTEFVHGKVLFDKTTATGAPDPGDAVDNDDNGKIEETHRGTITDDFSVSGGGTVNTIDFGFITRVLIDWDDPNNQWGFVLDTPEADGSITSTGDLDGTGNPYFTDISGTGVDMNVTLAGQDPDNDLSDAPGDRDELTEWLNADSKHAGIMPLFAHLGGEATFNLGYGEGSWDDCLLVEFDFTDTTTGAPVAVKDVSFKIFDIDKTNWTGPLGSEVSGRGLGWIDRVTIQGYAGASLVDPIYNHVNGAPVDDPVNNPYTSEPDGTAYMKVDGNSLEGRWEFSEKDASYTNNPDTNNWNTSGTYGAASGNVDVSFASPITKFTWKHENLWSDGTTNRTSPDPYWGGHSMEIGLSDIAFTVTAALGDYVWIDLDRDGEQDPLEPPLEGVLVELLDDGGTPILTTTTDASGAYFFADIPLGDYTVRFTPPVGGGYIASPADQGGDDALDSDIDASGVTGVLNITSVQTDITVDAGFIPPGGVLGDFVFLDANANGEQDPGELGIEGVTVNLLDEFGAPVLDGSNDPITTTTNADGVYFFSGLAEGDYIVEFVPPANHVASPQDQGGQDDSDSDIDPVTFRTDPVNVKADESVLDVDAGFYELVSLGDLVFNDANGNGVQDAGEIGLPGVTVNLLDGNGDPVDDASGDPITTVTDGSGAYLFEGLDPGDYIVEFVQPTGFGTVAQDAGGDDTIDSDYDPATGETAVISLAPGDDDSSTDAGFLPPNRFAQIGDTVWEDLDRDGIQDPGEPTVSGVTVKLLDSFGNPVTDTQGNPVTTTTDAGGNYYFIVDPLNDYFIEFEPPGGYTITAQDAGSDETADSDADPVSFRTDLIVVGDNEVNLDIDAGIVGASIGDRVWIDLDRNGEQDPNEAGLEGVLVELLDENGDPVLDGSGSAITTTTDANGNYELTGFPPGIYTVRFTAPGYTPTDADQGDDALDSDIDLLGVTGPIDMTGPGSDFTVDAGFLPRGSALGDFVFTDANADGEQDPGETGIAGVTVNLLDASGTPILDGSGSPVTTTTNADGYYYFDDLGAGDYIVEVVPPQDFLVSPQDAADDKRDSDIDPATNRTDVISLGVDESDVTVDAGLYELGSIGNFVFNDADENGIQGAGEIGIPGVVVYLLDGVGDPVLDGSGNPVTATTDPSGFYEFTGLLAGDYILDFVTPSGFATVAQDSGGDDTIDSDYDPGTGETAVISLGLGENNMDVDAGYLPPNRFAQLGDTVWEDLDRDGIQDPGEPGVEGVVVNLLDASGNPVLDADGNPTTVTTDANGNYLFIVDPASDYILEFAPTAGFVIAAQDVGSDETADSDVDAATYRTDLIVLANDEVNLDIDAGFVGASIGDRVWIDLDRNGEQDPNEAGLEGVLVELLDENGDPVLDGSGNPITTTTDADGNYELFGFPPGIYTVRFTAVGYTPTDADQGDDALDSDIDLLGVTGPIDMTGPGSDYTVDAGFLPRGSALGDFVFTDANADGEQDPGETGIAGVTVNLLDASGTPILDGSGSPVTTTTNADGYYYFDDLTAGDYIVEFVAPADHLVSPQDAADDKRDSDIDPVTLRTEVVSLGADDSDLDVDAGFYPLGSIGNYVFNDADNDGIQDSGEIGIPGVVVSLLDGIGDPVLDEFGDPVTTVTDINGFYEFTGLLPGDYIVDFSTPNGFTTVNPDRTTDDLDSDYNVTTGQTPVISLALGENNEDVDAGYRPPGNFVQLGDTVWSDLDGDGIQDPGEPGLEGVVVKLLDGNGDPVLDADGNETTVTTDANGNYLFILNPASDYMLEFVPPLGASFTLQGEGTDPTADSDVDPATNRTGVLTFSNGDINLDIDAGVLVTNTLGDTVWVDLDNDGVQDPHEPGLEGVTVELLDVNGDPVLDGSGNPYTTTTDSNGNYELKDFPPGTYQLRFTPPGGETPTSSDQGGDDTLDSDIDGSGLTGLIDMTEPRGDLTVDAGFLPESPVIGDFVFNDADGDGVQDPGETGIEGVTVNLLDGNGDPVLDGSGDPITTTTGSNGGYYFDNLSPGDYIIEVIPPGDYGVSPQDQGGDDTLDSDLDPQTNRTGVITLGAETIELTVDIGLFQLASIGDFVFNDEDGDGKQDPGETGIPGVVVNLLDGTTGLPVLDENNQPITTTSDASGYYAFTGLIAGDYILDFETPAGFTTVNQDNNGLLDDLDSDYDPDDQSSTYGQTAVISLSQGENVTDVDAGYKPPDKYNQIGDTVWNDLNRDGIQDPGEEGVEGVVVKLLDANGDPVLNAEGNPTTVTTDANGNYHFIVEKNTSYILEFVPTSGKTLTSQDEGTDEAADSDADATSFRTDPIAVGEETVYNDIDAGLVGASIGDRVWMDLDGDGVQDINEAGLAGVTVALLDENGVPVLDGNGVAITDVTDSNGNYELFGFDPGIYTVSFTPPAGYTATTANQGDDALDSDISALGVTGPIDMTGPGSDYTVDAGFLPLRNALGDVVFNDLDSDGEQDSGEVGIEGVTVNLLDAAGTTVLATTTTDANGSYYFDDLDDGSYIVEVELPAAYAYSPQNQAGGDDALDSDVDTTTGRTAVISLSGNQVDTTVDAGVYALGSIGDFVYLDVDGDGKQEPAGGDVGLPGVVVNLLDGDTGLPVLDDNNDPITTTTDASGYYVFTELVGGNYIVDFETPSGFTTVNKDNNGLLDDQDSDYDPSNGETDVIALGNGENITHVDAGYSPPDKYNQIGDTVWNDLNRDGIQDPGEEGVEGVVVKLLDASGNPVLNAEGNPTTVTTDENGNYHFIVEKNTSYILEFVPTSGKTLTSQDEGTDEAADSDADATTYRTDVIPVGEQTVYNDIDAGLVGASIGDTVWVDLNSDGVQDINEAGLAGVTVALLDENGVPVLDGNGVAITDVTDSNGNYELFGFDPGIYTVSFTPPAGYDATIADQGDDALDSDISALGVTGPIDMTGPGSDYTVDAGFLPIDSAIGDVVFNDPDADGIQDPGELGVEGVTVNLLDASGNPVLDGSGNPITTTTDANGAYYFDGLDAGDYIVEVVPPENFAVTLQDQGVDDGLDSDFDPATGQSGVIALGTDEVNTTVDAGLYELASIGNFVFNDTDADGRQDATELGLPGVTVYLLDGLGNPILDENGDPVSTTSDASGFYQFTDLPPGDYIVQFATPDGYQTVQQDRDQADPNVDIATDSDYNELTGQTDVITLAAGEDNVDVDAGFDPIFGNFAQLGSTVWDDLDGDGIQDPGEPGVEGVVVKLLDASGNPILDADGNETTVTTDANGDFLFLVDPDFDYILEFVPPPGESFTTQGAGTDGAVDSDVDPVSNQTGLIVIGNDEINLNLDAGLAPPVPNSIGDTVWIDSDADGVQDPGETGLVGVTVSLLDGSGNPVLDGGGQPITTTTSDGTTDVDGDTVIDPAGSYYFGDLVDGDYIVEFSAPAGYVISPLDSGTDDSADSDADPVTGQTAVISLSGGTANDTVDAGMYELVTIEGSVLVNDGAGNLPLGGVTLILLDENGDPVLDGGGQPITTTSDPTTGAYTFDGLPPGTYQVGQLQPDGYTSTSDTDGADNNVIGDETAITLTSGQTSSGNDFVESTAPPTGAIGNYVWLDENGDGIQDAGEAGIPGVTVNLRDGGGSVIATTTTDADGGYLFTGLAAGSYTVEVDGTSLPAGLNLTGDPDIIPDGTHTLFLADGEEYLTADFGYNYVPSGDSSSPTSGATGSIGDTVWNDANGDGVQDPGESGIEGVTVNLFDDPDGDGIYDNLVATTTTAPDGGYIFDDLAPDGYVVEVVDPAGYTLTGDPDGTLDGVTEPIGLAPGDVVVLADFGYDLDSGGADIGDTIFVDADGDGTQAVGEPGIPGVTVALLDAAGDVIATTPTDESGKYLFPGLPDGDYTVVVTDTENVLGELDPISDPDGTLDNQSTVTLLGGVDDLDQDFGYAPPGHDAGEGLIGDTVFLDGDGDNTPDAGEGVEGVTVELYDATGTVLLASTTTDENGNYYFGGLDPAGTYTVKVDATTLPNGGTGLTNTVDPNGGNDSESVVDLSATGGTNLDQDFGYVPAVPNTIGGTIWDDTNADGTLNEGATSGIEGVTVVLLDGDGNVVATTTTDANGDYSFTNLPDGTYTVDVTDVDDVLNGYWHSDGPNDGLDNNSQDDPYSVTVSGGATDTTGDFGYYVEPASIGNFVFGDVDGDGIQDPGEPGLGGVEVTLTITYPTGDTVVLTTVTDLDGFYSFDGLLLDESYAASGGAGEPTYTVTVATPDGLAPTLSDEGGDDTVDSDDGLTGESAELVQGGTDDTNDFGYVPTGVIGNYVWLDENGDGVQDAGEAGIGGATVELYDATGTVLLATTTTDADGGYIFTDVAPGDYVVKINGTSLDPNLNLTGDPDATLDGEHSVTLAPGDEYLSADFGYNWVPSGDSTNPTSGATGAIGDMVWNDADGDGIQDPGESGIEGVTVNLYDDPDGDGIYDNLVATTTTNPDGSYIFDGLDPDSYVVEVVDPTGYTQTGDPDGILDGATTYPVVLAPGDVITIADFGYDLDSGGATIGDTIYLDVNGNGTHDPGTDVGIAGVTVALLDAAGNVIATTTTAADDPSTPGIDESGTYSFPGLPTGEDYTVVVTDTDNVLGHLAQIGDPDGTLDGTSTVTNLTADDLDQDFGYATLGHAPGAGFIGDTVYLDGDGSGTPDPGEGVEGIIVELWDATGTTLLATTTTDENGNYSFGGLDANGTYTVKVNTTGTVLAGTTNTVDPDGANDSESVVDLAATGGTDLDQDFGYVPAVPNTIGGTIWEDTNADGSLTESGNGIEGVTVVLLDPNGDVVATTATDANGDYSFTNVPDGTYTVDVTDDGNLLDGYWHSESTDQVSDGTSKTDPYTVTVSGGATDTTGDFGYYVEPAVLGNFIFEDLDGDGIQDGGEPGIAGVVVTLTVDYPNGDTVVVSTTTAPDGSYTFIGLLDESFASSGGVGEPVYTVTVATPDRYAPSPSNVGGDDTIDSDNGVTGETAELVQGGDDPTNDFGFVKQKATNYDDFITDAGLDPNAVDGSGQPVPDASGTGGNPDGDYSSNLLEHAFCDTPNSGVPNHFGFCVELVDPATGQIDASFIRAEGIEDVIYTLQGRDDLLGTWVDIATIPAGQAATAPFTVTSNGDGTETVTYANLESSGLAGLTAESGLVRLCVSLDSEPDGTPDTAVLPSDPLPSGALVELTDYTKTFGWQCVTYNQAECASASTPFTVKPVFTGTLTTNTGAALDAAASAGGVDLATLNLGPIDIDPSAGVELVPTHYVQVTSGAHEGERFDIASASGGTLTIVSDPDIFEETLFSLNTSNGVPADTVLAGATFQVLPHHTIDSRFNKTGGFAGLEGDGVTTEPAKLLFYNSRSSTPGFEMYELVDSPDVRWILSGDRDTVDQGLRPIDRCAGNYIHPMEGAVMPQCEVGLVADYDIACPFNVDYNLVGAPYPLDQTATGTDGRAMTVGAAASEFNGGIDPNQAAEIFFWLGDMTVDDLPSVVPYMEGYENVMAADDGGSFQQWVDINDPALNDLGASWVLESHRAATVKILPGNTLEPHIYPLPGTP